MEAAYRASTGQAVEVFRHKDKDFFEFYEDALELILLDSRVRNSKVMVVSVGGSYAAGNSFLLNVFIKYLKNPNKPDWMVNPDVPLEGFKCLTSHKFHTTGIIMWSEPFFIMTPSGEEVCVLLVDTEGFDKYIGPRPHLDRVLALSSFISSVQLFSCYNMKHMELKYVIDSGKMAMEVSKTKPYQTLYVLVPSLNGTQKYPLGFEGGEELWEKEVKEHKLTIPECFEDILCYVIPYPGDCVRNRKFSGCLSEKGVNPEFINSLKVLTEHVFDPKNVVIKEIDGKQVTGREFFHYFKSYAKLLQGGPPQLSAWSQSVREVLRMINDGQIDNIPGEVRSYLNEADSVSMKEYFRAVINNHIPGPKAMTQAKMEAKKLIAETEDICIFKDLMGTTQEEVWNGLAMDRVEEFYRSKITKFMHGEDMYRINGMILKAYHNACCRSAMDKLRRLGVANQTCKDKLKDRLLKLYYNYVKEFECNVPDFNSQPLTIDKINRRPPKVPFSEVKKFK